MEANREPVGVGIPTTCASAIELDLNDAIHNVLLKEMIDKVAPIISAVTAANPTDCGVIDGSITITASGGGPLQYSIDGGTTWQASDNFTGLQAATYEISCWVFYENILLDRSPPARELRN